MPKQRSEAWGAWFREAREAAGRSMYDGTAYHPKLTKGRIQALENGSEPTYREVRPLARFLKIYAGDLRDVLDSFFE